MPSDSNDNKHTGSNASPGEYLQNNTLVEFTNYDSIIDTGLRDPNGNLVGNKSWGARGWSSIDNTLLKPMLTHIQPCLLDTMYGCNQRFLRAFTSAEQLQHRER